MSKAKSASKAPKKTFAQELKLAHEELIEKPTKKLREASSKCHVSVPTIYNWMRGLTPIKQHHKTVLAEIYGIVLEKEVPHEA